MSVEELEPLDAAQKADREKHIKLAEQLGITYERYEELGKRLDAALKVDREKHIKRAEQLGMTYADYEEWYWQQNPIIRHREFVAIYGPSDDPYDDFAIRDRATGKMYYDYEALGPNDIQLLIKWLNTRIFKPLYNKLREHF